MNKATRSVLHAVLFLGAAFAVFWLCVFLGFPMQSTSYALGMIGAIVGAWAESLAGG